MRLPGVAVLALVFTPLVCLALMPLLDNPLPLALALAEEVLADSFGDGLDLLDLLLVFVREGIAQRCLLWTAGSAKKRCALGVNGRPAPLPPDPPAPAV